MYQAAKQSARLKKLRLLQAERANGPTTAATRGQAAAAEATCEAPTDASIADAEAAAVDGTVAEAATEGPTNHR